MIDTTLRVMGTDAHVIVVGPDSLAPAITMLHVLEARWSRFRDDSELSRLNALAGRPVIVSPVTYACIELAVAAARLTGGRFDPTVDVAAIGYDRTFEDVVPDAPAFTPVPAPGVDGIALDPTTRAVTLPAGVALDLGGIGKGYAADLLVADLRRRGADGACVNVGGDLRAEGDAPGPDGWTVALDENDCGLDRLVAVAAGSVATSTTGRRRWTRDGRPVHHLVDPRTGRPAHSGIRTVTVIADEAWRAEALATAALITGPGDAARVVTDEGATGFLVTDAGTIEFFPKLEDYLR